MRRFILFLIINTLFIFTNAQDNNCHCKYYNVSEETLEDKLTGIQILNEQVKMPDGELYSQWSSGDVILNNGEKITNRTIRYDGLNDQLTFYNLNKKAQLAVEKGTIKGFDIQLFTTNKMLHFTKLKINNLYSPGYEEHFVQILVAGKVSLYASRKLHNLVSSNQLETSYFYILVKEDGSSTQFQNFSRRYIVNLFPDKENIFRPSLKKQKNRVRTEEQLIKAIELYNSL